MNDNLKEAIKEVDNLDVCKDGKETIKKILCKVVGEKYEENGFIKMEMLTWYKAKEKKGHGEWCIVKVLPQTTHLFINKSGRITHIMDDGNDEEINKDYSVKKIGDIKEIKFIEEEELL